MLAGSLASATASRREEEDAAADRPSRSAELLLGSVPPTLRSLLRLSLFFNYSASVHGRTASARGHAVAREPAVQGVPQTQGPSTSSPASPRSPSLTSSIPRAGPVQSHSPHLHRLHQVPQGASRPPLRLPGGTAGREHDGSAVRAPRRQGRRSSSRSQQAQKEGLDGCDAASRAGRRSGGACGEGGLCRGRGPDELECVFLSLLFARTSPSVT